MDLSVCLTVEVVETRCSEDWARCGREGLKDLENGCLEELVVDCSDTVVDIEGGQPYAARYVDLETPADRQEFLKMLDDDGPDDPRRFVTWVGGERRDEDAAEKIICRAAVQRRERRAGIGGLGESTQEAEAKHFFLG